MAARVIALLGVACLAGSGCAQRPPAAPVIPVTAGPPRSAVFYTPELLAMTESQGRLFDFEFPEYSRRDAMVGYPPAPARPSVWELGWSPWLRYYDVLLRRLDRNIELRGPSLGFYHFGPSLPTVGPRPWWWRGGGLFVKRSWSNPRP